jgi:membrane-associated phospholipid phosphatase
MIWQFLSIFGDIQFWMGTALTSLIFLFTVPKRARKHIAWFVFLVLPTVIISWGVTQNLKEIFKIPRPCLGLPYCPTTYSFPSGHATVIFAAAGVLSLYYKDKRLTVFLFISACLVALSRMILNVHRIEDIVFGSIIGLVTGFLIQKAYVNYQKEIKEFVSELK